MVRDAYLQYPPNTVIKSHVGYSETYATDNHAPFRKNEYTSNNFFENIKDVILEYRPDTIYCVDYDSHIDHRAVSLAFEKVFGEILKEQPEYRPAVLKGFAYCTAWNAPEDFYSVNVLSTKNPTADSDYISNATCYRWDNRLRLPVNLSSLSRSVLSSNIYKELSAYSSQNAVMKSVRIINGDKVFWERSTESLSYTANVSASSGNADFVNNFMLYDNYNLLKECRFPGDGIWIPDVEDENKSITITLGSPSYIDCIYLYDNPSEIDNILNAEIILDNGKTFDTGALNKYGTSTCVFIGEKNIESLTIKLKSVEGDCAGLSEVELYQSTPHSNFNYIKLMDENEDFAYDYIVSREEKFYLYCVGDTPELSRYKYTVECNNKKCSAEIVDNYLKVICPKNESCIIKVTDTSGRFSDSIYVSNKTCLVDFWQNIDEGIFRSYRIRKYIKSVIHKVIGLAS